MNAHYDEEYHKAITTAGEIGKADRWRRPNELISQYKNSGSILDIGCSSGAFLSTMGNGWRLFGIEMETSTAEKAKARTGAEVFVGEAMNAPFAAESFDVITCFDVLEHVYDPRKFITRVREWLRPDGIFCTTLPNIDSWEAQVLGSYWYGLELPRHLFHFSPVSLRNLMAELGFTEKHLRTNSCYVERSVSYLRCRAMELLGLPFEPPSKPRSVGLSWRVFRKVLRVTLVSPFSRMAAMSGSGGSIEAVFAKAQMAPSLSVDHVPPRKRARNTVE